MGRVAVVTGGTRGIGAAAAASLKAAGYAVAAGYRADEAAADRFMQATGIPVFRWDAADYGACEGAVRAIVDALGPIEVLVNNAGITHDGALHKMAAEQWRAVIDHDLSSCFNMTRPVIGPMREHGFGRIINISSINGQKGQFGQTNYAAAKAGVIGFTKALALENAAKGVTVNAIAPGYIATDMVAAMAHDALDKIIAQIPVGRLGRPEEIARAVRFLASDEAGFITGSTLSINGGQYLA
jgi:acetoacetyl-CoA reductase